MRMSSCFFSSRLNTRISAKSEWMKRWSTALPKEPVPPVIIRVLSLNINQSCEIGLGSAEFSHAAYQLGPRRRLIAGGLAKTGGGKRAVNGKPGIGSYLRVPSVGLGHQGQELEFV